MRSLHQFSTLCTANFCSIFQPAQMYPSPYILGSQTIPLHRWTWLLNSQKITISWVHNDYHTKGANNQCLPHNTYTYTRSKTQISASYHIMKKTENIQFETWTSPTWQRTVPLNNRDSVRCHRDSVRCHRDSVRCHGDSVRCHGDGEYHQWDGFCRRITATYRAGRSFWNPISSQGDITRGPRPAPSKGACRRGCGPWISLRG